MVRRPSCVLERLLAEIDHDRAHPMAWQRDLLERTRQELGPAQEVLIKDLIFLSLDDTVAGGAEAADILRRIEADCLAEPS